MSDAVPTLPLRPRGDHRARLAAFLESRLMRDALMAVILFNAAILGLETSETVMDAAGPAIHALDRLCLAVFVLELLAKLYALGPRFFRSGWNLFDFAVVGVSLAPSSEGLSVLRALRVLRVLRVISVAPSLRRVVDGLVRALPGMGSVVLLLSIVLYVGAVMATKLFGAEYPDQFGHLGASALTLFQLMTFDGWMGEIVAPVMEEHPYAWLFFLPFMVATGFAVLNLLVGLVVNAMQEAAEDDRKAEAAAHEAQETAFEAEVLRRLRAIEERLPR
jgi:voltage-gated sodium channel